MTPTTIEVDVLLKMLPLFIGGITLVAWLVKMNAKIESHDEKLKLNDKLDVIIKLLEEKE